MLCDISRSRFREEVNLNSCIFLGHIISETAFAANKSHILPRGCTPEVEPPEAAEMH